MKLTKEIIRTLKYHGFVTITSPDEFFLKYFKTVEDFAEAGFINNVGAITMVMKLFDAEGKPLCGPTTEKDTNPEPELSIVGSHEPEPEIKSEPEPEHETETKSKPEPTPEPVKEKKTTTKTTKKTTKKES